MNLKKEIGRAYASEVLHLLKARYRKQMRTSLSHETPWQLLVATILSAQSQDAHVNKVTPALFRDLPAVEMYANLRPKDLYRYTKGVGLFRSKSKSIIESAKRIVNAYHGTVPRSMGDLTTLRGVGRKTANVVLSNAFGINAGIAIDTHCITVANRLGLAHTKDPAKIEKELMAVIPNRDWSNASHLFIALGRDVCTAREKRCGKCVLGGICLSSTVRKRSGRLK